jgi:hypothetical protein
MVEEIAANDYGEDVHEHLSGIENQLHGDQPLLGLLPWHPREVLELERWAEPDRPCAEAEPTGRRGHVRRLLATTILLRNAGRIQAPEQTGEEEFFVETSVATVARLALSAVALEEEARYLALQFLLWFYQAQASAIIRPFTAFAVLLLSVTERQRFQDADISDACKWCIAVEYASRVALGRTVASAAWLVGLSTYELGVGRGAAWRDLSAAVVRREDLASCPALSCVADLSARLTE